MNAGNRTVLRGLAEQYADICADPVQEERRALWRQHNSLKKTRPLIYTRAFAWHEMPQSQCVCDEPLARQYEGLLRQQLFWHSLGDDSIFEPWITIQAVGRCHGWGVSGERHFSDEPGGSFKVGYPIKELSDIDKLRVPWHEIDEAATAVRAEEVSDAIGDIITINLDRAPAYRVWTGDISTDLGYLRGIENVMMDMLDNPEWLHRLVKFLGDGILKTHNEAELKGDWGLSAHQNQAMPYAEELEDPAANVNGINRKALWVYVAAQELTAVSPTMHDEFVLQYQLPILKHFGLVAYGCCEDLTNKMDMLRQIPNLRRIAVSPFANVARCAEQIGRDYVLSYRPSPADMVSYGFDATRIRTILSRDLEACRECHVDITLKDVETVERDPDRVRNWVNVTRNVIDEIF
ncbi:MAG: hypothetical protein RRC34_08070 [Lentisphaeria bacterium]|nr:hypothetical protein [Lentisphaeria bacterium]